MTHRDKPTPVALVTGGASGIGRAIGDELGARGWRVFLADLDAPALSATVAAAAGRGAVEGRVLDVTDPEAVERLVREIASTAGRFDLIVNNAGVHVLGEARDTPLEDWHRLVSVNLMGVVHGCRAAYAVMRTQGFGRIVNVASVAGLAPAAGEAAYAATKHAVVGYSLSLRAEAAAFGVTVSVACPGLTDTAMLRTSRVHRLDRQKLLARLPYAPMPVETAARRIVDGALRGAAVIVPALLSRALWWLHRMSPRASVWVGRRVVARLRAARLDDGTNLFPPPQE